MSVSDYAVPYLADTFQTVAYQAVSTKLSLAVAFCMSITPSLILTLEAVAYQTHIFALVLIRLQFMRQSLNMLQHIMICVTRLFLIRLWLIGLSLIRLLLIALKQQLKSCSINIFHI